MPSAFPIPPTLRDARQLLLVVAGGWSSRDARLQRLERRGGAAPWKVIGQPVAVSLGRSGLAPASGQAAACAPDVPPKREGDGRSPAGIFPITALFGDAGPDSDLARAARLPWLHGTRDLKCMDDLASRYYNQIVDSTRVDRVGLGFVRGHVARRSGATRWGRWSGTTARQRFRGRGRASSCMCGRRRVCRRRGARRWRWRT